MTPSKKDRRDFIKTSGILAAGFLGLQRYASTPLLANNQVTKIGYGPLKPDPKGILDLPDGFSYKIISRMGTKMSDGLLVPGKADGMATFKGSNGKTIIIRNHEVSTNSVKEGAFGKKYELLEKVDKQKVYDYGKGEAPCLGGTTTLIYDEEAGTIESEFMSLAGTIRNCAGGPTPWNSWISCEEDVTKADGTFEKNHGYAFEVPVTETPQLCDPIPLKAMGRFNHEAVAVDPETSIVYQTEDRHDGLIYRFIPNEKQQLSKGGRLQALAIKGQKSVDTRNWKNLNLPTFPIGKKIEVEWIDLEDIDAPKDDLRFRGFDQGAARFARGEGIWFGDRELYFACTNGGKIAQGQVFKYTPSKQEGTPGESNDPGALELFVEPNDTDLVTNCDNLTIAPWGDIILCEDTSRPRIVGVTPKGEFYKIGKNVGYKSEFAGATFSPSGKVLFVNIQHAGLTLAITGPWQG
ncbi:DUF839 domain-containing protein [Fulvivirgaceae bacterium BMA10]|uniref:DUF839 domain-containing protein n=1 Tax=Splendidivirga corallicola TaxID=3051826 RepID=A0ABT8KJ95_9BACT|nr:DUF839 domain-containing protein [Fulvivirgaceae bacterium BMA10]